MLNLRNSRQIKDKDQTAPFPSTGIVKYMQIDLFAILPEPCLLELTNAGFSGNPLSFEASKQYLVEIASKPE
jgi:hypothetical protein